MCILILLILKSYELVGKVMLPMSRWDNSMSRSLRIARQVFERAVSESISFDFILKNTCIFKESD
ncbi:hypothetical protein [Leptospira interrogans]|nr:hypothetical protein [Leptospira interrogans]